MKTNIDIIKAEYAKGTQTIRYSLTMNTYNIEYLIMLNIN